MNITVIKEFSDNLLQALNGLLPQLSSSAQALDSMGLIRIIESDSCHLLIASEGDAIFGMLTLVVFSIPTGVRAWVEDVVVNENARGEGVGSQLIEAAIALSFDKGATTIDLTSNPSRKQANRLYQKLGFKKRETNVFRFVKENA